MTQISVQEIQLDPLAFVRRIEAGEPLQIVRGDVAIAGIPPVSPRAKRTRPYGLAAGEFTVPDDFDQSLPEDVVKLFEGS